MRSKLACAALLVSSIGGAPAGAGSDTGAEFLSGNWAIVGKTGVSSCEMPAAHGDQIGFEFARSGGRAVFYEVPDLFSAIGGLEVRSEGDILILTARTRSGEVKPFQRIRRKGPNEAEIVSETSSRPLITLRRCMAPAHQIAEGVSDANLFALTPAYSGGQGLPQLLAGETPTDICDGKAKPGTGERGWVQFDLIGPHFWAMFNEPGPVAGFSTILSVRQTAADTVRLSMRRWGAAAPTDLTIQISEDRIDIPELQATFARCRPDQSASFGMHRM